MKIPAETRNRRIAAHAFAVAAAVGVLVVLIAPLMAVFASGR